VGLIAYFLGSSAGSVIEAFGLWGLAAVALAIVAGLVAHRRHVRHRRRTEPARSAGEGNGRPHDTPDV
jgi:hypothetical protein